MNSSVENTSSRWLNPHFYTDSLESLLTSRETLINAVRVYNVAAAVFVLYGYLTTPSAGAMEHLGDVGIHLLQACATENSSGWLTGAILLLNPYRLFDIYNRTFQGISTFPYLLTGLDIFNHSLNIVTTTLIIEHSQKEHLKKE